MGYSIKSRLTTALVIVILVIVGLGALSIWSQERIGESVQILETQNQKMALITDLQLAINEAVMPANDYIITGDPRYRKEFEVLDIVATKSFTAIKTYSGFSLDEKRATEKSELFYGGLRDISHRILTTDSKNSELPALMEKMDYELAAPAVAEIATLKKGIAVSLETARNNVTAVKKFTRKVVIAVVMIFIVAAIVFGTVICRSITTPINETVAAFGAAAAGDLSGSLTLSSRSEFGILSEKFNILMESMREIVDSIAGTTRKVSRVARSTKESSQRLNKSAQTQLATLETTASAQEEMHFSIRSVASDSEELLKFTEATSRQAQQLSTEMSEIAQHAEGLDILREKTASSVGEIAASINRVASNVDDLFERTEQIVNTVTEMDATIAGISGHSKQQAVLSEKVRENASGFGMETVRGSRESIEKIRNEVSASARGIHRLGNMSGDIGKIVEVINEMAGITNLLSLNAAILAAQAGAHGKGFAVVADQIKRLSGQTASSTREISDIITRVQTEVALSVGSINCTLKSVEEGLERSREAESSLARIVSAAESSLEMAKSVECSLGEQSVGISIVLENMLHVNSMVIEIKKATEQESIAAREIFTGTNVLADYTGMIRQLAREQSRGSKALSDLSREESERMGAVTQAVAEQEKAAASIVESIEATRREAGNNVRMAAELDELMKTLEVEGDTLSASIERFKV